MGALVSCCRQCCGDKDGQDNYETIGGNTSQTPDPEDRRRQLAEAAMKRREQEEHRGVKDVEAVRRKREQTEKREKLEEDMARRGQRGDEPGLQWTVK